MREVWLLLELLAAGLLVAAPAVVVAAEAGAELGRLGSAAAILAKMGGSGVRKTTWTRA